MTEIEAKKEIEQNVFYLTDNVEMTISKECYKTIINVLEKQIEIMKMKYKVVADNGQTLLMNLMYKGAINYANAMKEKYPENNFFVIKQE